MFRLISCCVLVLLLSNRADAQLFGRIRGSGHNALVAQSGIRPNQVGTHEGVGMSSRSHQDALQSACYYGKRQIASVQYSTRGGMYYAVVRYW
jgi:hypothetical protein